MHNHCLQFLLSQEKSKTMPMHFFLGGGGGGREGVVKEVYYGIVQVENQLKIKWVRIAHL